MINAEDIIKEVEKNKNRVTDTEYEDFKKTLTTLCKKFVLVMPHKHDLYYYIDDTGNVSITTSEWLDDEIDMARWNTGNVYTSYDAVEKASKKKYWRTQIIHRIYELNENWEPEIGETYYLFDAFFATTASTKKIYVSVKSTMTCIEAQQPLKSSKIAYQLLDEFGADKILKYYFNVEVGSDVEIVKV